MDRNARFAWLVALGAGASLLLSAGDASAARVVDVRVGKHAEFTRVVFELDAPAGYRIERGGPDDRELIVLMDAQGNGKRIGAKQALIESVELEPQGFRSVGRIQLAGRELRLKEMILANPPRIVLDVMRPEDRPIVRLPAAKSTPVASTPAAPKTPPAPRATAAPAKPQTPRIAQVEAAPPAPAKRAAQDPSTRAAIPEPLLEADPRLQEIVLDGIEVAQVEQLEEVEIAANAPAERPQDLLGIAPPPKPARDAADPLAGDGKPRAPRPNAAAPSLAVARARSTASAEPEPEASFDLVTVGMAGGGLLLLLGGLLIWRRRRTASATPLDFDDDAGLGDENPFAAEDGALTDSSEGATREQGFGSPDGDEQTQDPVSATGRAGEPAEPVEPMGDLFAGFDSDEAPPSDIPVTEPAFRDNAATSIQEPTQTQEGTRMDTQTTDHTATRVMDMASGPITGAAPQADQSELVRELERRVLSLETRLEEMLESRERLEKQMAAQTEELRVQRAAIARTQRAVRNINRTEEDAPTEPALRDPERPDGSRSE